MTYTFWAIMTPVAFVVGMLAIYVHGVEQDQRKRSEGLTCKPGYVMVMIREARFETTREVCIPGYEPK